MTSLRVAQRESGKHSLLQELKAQTIREGNTKVWNKALRESEMEYKKTHGGASPPPLPPLPPLRSTTNTAAAGTVVDKKKHGNEKPSVKRKLVKSKKDTTPKKKKTPPSVTKKALPKTKDQPPAVNVSHGHDDSSTASLDSASVDSRSLSPRKSVPSKITKQKRKSPASVPKSGRNQRWAKQKATMALAGMDDTDIALARSLITAREEKAKTKTPEKKMSQEDKVPVKVASKPPDKVTVQKKSVPALPHNNNTKTVNEPNKTAVLNKPSPLPRKPGVVASNTTLESTKPTSGNPQKSSIIVARGQTPGRAAPAAVPTMASFTSHRPGVPSSSSTLLPRRPGVVLSAPPPEAAAATIKRAKTTATTTPSQPHRPGVPSKRYKVDDEHALLTKQDKRHKRSVTTDDGDDEEEEEHNKHHKSKHHHRDADDDDDDDIVITAGDVEPVAHKSGRKKHMFAHAVMELADMLTIENVSEQIFKFLGGRSSRVLAIVSKSLRSNNIWTKQVQLLKEGFPLPVYTKAHFPSLYFGMEPPIGLRFLTSREVIGGQEQDVPVTPKYFEQEKVIKVAFARADAQNSDWHWKAVRVEQMLCRQCDNFHPKDAQDFFQHCLTWQHVERTLRESNRLPLDLTDPRFLREDFDDLPAITQLCMLENYVKHVIGQIQRPLDEKERNAITKMVIEAQMFVVGDKHKQLFDGISSPQSRFTVDTVFHALTSICIRDFMLNGLVFRGQARSVLVGKSWEAYPGGGTNVELISRVTGVNVHTRSSRMDD